MTTKGSEEKVLNNISPSGRQIETIIIKNNNKMRTSYQMINLLVIVLNWNY